MPRKFSEYNVLTAIGISAINRFDIFDVFVLSQNVDIGVDGTTENLPFFRCIECNSDR